jgi:hypothetical protein
MKLAVGQPRSMRQQIPERDRSYCLVGGVERSLRIAQHTQLRELGCAHRDRIVQRESFLVEQHQGDDGRHRLGHRRDPEDGVAFDSTPTRKVPASDGSHMDDVVVAPRQRRGAGEFSRINEALDGALDRLLVFHIERKSGDHRADEPNDAGAARQRQRRAPNALRSTSRPSRRSERSGAGLDMLEPGEAQILGPARMLCL